MNRSEQILIDVFESTSSLPRQEVFMQAETQDSRTQVRQAYTALLSKGVLAEDMDGIVTFYRKRAEAYDRLYPLLESADEDL